MTMATKSKTPVIVTLSGKRNVHDVARELKAAGLKVDSVLEETGIVTGQADLGSHSRLRKVRGVSDVSVDNPVDIGPPDSKFS
jgi:hypothetical protein